MKKKTNQKSLKSKFVKLLKKGLILFNILAFIWVLYYKFFPVQYTPLMFIRSYQEDYPIQKIKHHWVNIQHISTNLQKAVIASEDGKFTSHYGFDFNAISKVIKSNSSNKIRGASTISQQVAKNVFL